MLPGKCKLYFLLPALLLSLYACAQPSTSDSFYIRCIEPALNREELKSDTIPFVHPLKLEINHINADNKLVSLEYLANPDGFSDLISWDKGFKNWRKFYDSHDSLIYESIVLPDNKIIRCFSYQYNSKKQLIYREGFGPDEPGVKIFYEYDEAGRLRKETQHRAGGVTVIDHAAPGDATLRKQSLESPTFRRSVFWDLYEIE